MEAPNQEPKKVLRQVPYALAQVTELAELVMVPALVWGKSRDYIGSMSSIRRRRCGSIKPKRLSRTFWASSGVVTQRRRIVR